jgi:hypothetical protein
MSRLIASSTFIVTLALVLVLVALPTGTAAAQEPAEAPEVAVGALPRTIVSVEFDYEFASDAALKGFMDTIAVGVQTFGPHDHFEVGISRLDVKDSDAQPSFVFVGLRRAWALGPIDLLLKVRARHGDGGMGDDGEVIGSSSTYLGTGLSVDLWKRTYTVALAAELGGFAFDAVDADGSTLAFAGAGGHTLVAG